MKAFNAIAAILLIGLVGCSTGGSKKPSAAKDFPPDLADICRVAMYNAKACIEARDFDLVEKAAVRVVKVPGEKFFADGWGWKYEGRWVQALCHTEVVGKRYRIEVGCNPANMADVNPVIVEHEFGHYWMLSNFNEPAHVDQLSTCFLRWSSSNDKPVARHHHAGKAQEQDHGQCVTINGVIVLNAPE